MAASDFSDVFTQSIKFNYKVYIIQLREHMFKHGDPSTENGWMLLSTNFTAKCEIISF